MERPDKPLLEFPCRFMIKVIGHGPRDLEDVVVTIVGRHLGDLEGVTTTTRPSSKGRYLAVSVEFDVESRQVLDDIYRELGRLERVRMVL